MAQLIGFEGAAGTGKTHRLIEAVNARLRTSPLEPHQRVLALTFMHGSRRRLDERLSSVPGLRHRYECRTIDSFAVALLERWRSVAGALGLRGGTFDEVCEGGARLLELPLVAQWVARTHPVVVVDEAQDLSPERLRIVRHLASAADILLAADAFQCLDEEVDTSPFMDWMHTGEVLELTEPKRTSARGLLAAAQSIRSGKSPANGEGFEVRYEFPNNAPFAVGQVLRAPNGSSALIAAPGGRAWAQKIVERLQRGLQSKKQTIPPIRISWESKLEKEVNRLVDGLPEMDAYRAHDIAEMVRRLEHELPSWATDVVRAVQRTARVSGRATWTRDELRALVMRRGVAHAAHGRGDRRMIPALSIHAAKNREFSRVVVLWPYGVQGSDDHKRRLLYNAITRAQRTCKVFVQGRDLLKDIPFV